MRTEIEEISSDIKGYEFDKILKDTFYNAKCDYRNLDIKIFVEEVEAKIIKVSNDLKTLTINIERKKEDIMSELDINILKNAVVSIQKDIEEIQNDITTIKESIKEAVSNSDTQIQTLTEKVDNNKAELENQITTNKQELQSNIDNEKTAREEAITQAETKITAIDGRVKTLEEKETTGDV